MTYQPDNFVVWADIPTRDLDRAMGFYAEVLKTELKKERMGPNLTATFQAKDPRRGVAGHIYEGEPASGGEGPTIHLAAPGRLEDALARVRKAGGSVVSDPIEIPAGRFAYCRDLDGNSIGLFEA